MQILNPVSELREVWLQRSVVLLAQGATLPSDIRSILNRFFDLLIQSAQTQDPACLDTVLFEWSASLTQSDLEGPSSSLIFFLSELERTTFALLCENLSSQAALGAWQGLLPAFQYSFEKAAQLETQAKLNYLAGQLETTRQNLQKLERSKSDFIAVAAHELKTPLTLIDGYAAMLRENLDHEDANQPFRATLVDGIQTGARRLKTIIDDMIDVSLIDNDLLSLNFQPVWVNRLLSVLVEELRPAVEERSQQFEVVPFPGIQERTFGDPERLLQVFRNVLFNAVKFTPDGGKITVAGRTLPGFLEVTVTDTGIGIKPEDTGLIFEKFARLGNTALHSSSRTKFKGGGPGLGLHIAKGILTSHGGTIWVESPGYDEKTCPGSTFHVLIPLRTEPPDAKMAKLFAELQHKTQKEKVEPNGKPEN